MKTPVTSDFGCTGNEDEFNKKRIGESAEEVIKEKTAEPKSSADEDTGIEIPPEIIESLARLFWPDIVAFYQSEEGMREYEEWKKGQVSGTNPE